MLPVIVAPDVEAWAVAWLKTALAGRPEPYASGVWVSTRVPNPRKDRMVTVRRDGGPRADLIYQVPRLGVNVWTLDDIEAIDLARLVEGLLLSVRAVGPVEFVRSLSGPSSVEDAQPRQYLVVELTMRSDMS